MAADRGKLEALENTVRSNDLEFMHLGIVRPWKSVVEDSLAQEEQSGTGRTRHKQSRGK